MIKLERKFTPILLTPSFVQEKTDLYKRTKNNVWNIEWLKESLKELSSGKCAYCECSLLKESNYMEVEHFEDKKHNEDKVLDWDNLLPACKHCNGHKSTHDVIAEPIVNPFVDNPNNHLYFQYFRYKAKDKKGQDTIDVLDLNDGERKLVDVRFEIGDELQKTLEELNCKLRDYNATPTVKLKNKLHGAVHELMRQCLPDSEYSALCATVLHSCIEYEQLKQGMISAGIWKSTFDEYDKRSKAICLFK